MAKRSKKAKEITEMNARAELARIFGQRTILGKLPGYKNAEGLLEHGLQTMVRISQCGKTELELTAGKWLVEYATALIKSRPKSEQGVEIIANLRGLYQKALNSGPQGAPLVTVVEPERAADEGR